MTTIQVRRMVRNDNTLDMYLGSMFSGFLCEGDRHALLSMWSYLCCLMYTMYHKVSQHLTHYRTQREAVGQRRMEMTTRSVPSGLTGIPIAERIQLRSIVLELVESRARNLDDLLKQNNTDLLKQSPLDSTISNGYDGVEAVSNTASVTNTEVEAIDQPVPEVLVEQGVTSYRLKYLADDSDGQVFATEAEAVREFEKVYPDAYYLQSVSGHNIHKCYRNRDESFTGVSSSKEPDMFIAIIEPWRTAPNSKEVQLYYRVKQGKRVRYVKVGEDPTFDNWTEDYEGGVFIKKGTKYYQVSK